MLLRFLGLCLCDDTQESLKMVAGIGCGFHILGGIVLEMFVQEVFSKILLVVFLF